MPKFPAFDGGQVKEMVRDLMNVEVNTIIKADMSGSKAPARYRHLLYAISGKYHAKLVELGCRGEKIWTSAGLMSFMELYERADTGIKKIERVLQKTQPAPDPERALQLREALMMLTRIQSQCSRVIGLFVENAHEIKKSKVDLDTLRAEIEASCQQPGIQNSDSDSLKWNNDISRMAMAQVEDLTLTPPQVSMLRKMWEIGTERIILQTIVQVDGDITTRLSERFAREFNQTLFDVHNHSVKAAVGFWGGLITALGEMIGSLFKR